MLKAFGRRVQDDRGFTLIELMVVVLIIAILIAIAIPTFLGLRRRAQDRASQSELRNGVTVAKAFYTDGETYTGFDDPAATAIEGSLSWVDGGPASANNVHILSVGAAGQEVTMATLSESATEFCIADSSTAGTVRGVGSADTFAACAALPDW